MTTLQTVRVTNIRHVLDLLLKQSTATIRDLTATTNLSRPTVAKILSVLLKAEVIIKTGMGDTTIEGGKPPKLFSLNPRRGVLVGLHFSDNIFHGSLIDLRMNTIAEQRVSVPQNIHGDEFVELLCSMILSLCSSPEAAGRRCLGIGIGAPGITDSGLGEMVVSPHHPALGEHFALRDRLYERLGRSSPVYVDNLILFRTIAEQTVGHLRNVTHGAVVYCDDGLIAGIVINGEIHRGVNNLAGSIGHTTVNPTDSERCACGGYGCWEMQVVPERIVSRYRSLVQELPTMTPFDAFLYVMNRADDGEENAQRVMDEAAHWMAIGIHNLILSTDPQIISLQGVYARGESYFFSKLLDHLRHTSLLKAPFHTEIVCSSLGSDAANTGAASYALTMALASC